MAEREFTGGVEPLTKGLVTAVEKQALAGETIPDEIKRRYVATVGHELLVKKPVDTETRPEPEVTEADMTAMRIDLGEAPKVVVESVGQPEDEMRSAKSIAEDILLATTGREKSERDGQGEQRNEAIGRLRDEKVNMNYLFGNDLDRITQKEERLKRREGLQQLARDLVTGEIGVEQRKVLVNRLRIKKPSDVNVVGAGETTKSDNEPRKREPKKDDGKKEVKMKFEDRLGVADSLPDARDRLEKYKILYRESLKDDTDVGVSRTVLLREKMEMADSETKVGRVDVGEAGRRFDNLFNPLTAGSLKQQKEAARRWLDTYRGKDGISGDMISSVEAVINREMRLLEEEENIIRQYCLDSVFDRNGNNAMSIFASFFGPQGYLKTDMGKELEEVDLFRERIKEIVDELGLDNWIAVRETVSEWKKLKKPGIELTAGDLNESLFLPEYAERFFAGVVKPENPRVILEERLITLPDGVEVNMENEISVAMNKLRSLFETTDYFVYVGSPLSKKSQLYESNGINKYVGEVAFSLLLSHLMLTDAKKTATDPFMGMVCGGRKRVANYGVDEERDPFVNARIQSLLSSGTKRETIFSPDHKLTDFAKESLELWLNQVMPSKLIPTGMLGQGESDLKNDRWLRNRIENTYTNAERLTDPTVIANDIETRLAEMRSALEVLNAVKDTVKSDSDISTLNTLKSKMMIHAKSILPAAGLGTPFLIDEEFDYISLRTRDVSTDEWVSKAMLIASETFLYTHSVANYTNKKPWTIFTLAEHAKAILGKKPQSGAYSFLGFDPTSSEADRKELISYVDKLVSDCRDVFDVTTDRKNLKSLPNWYVSNGSISEEIIKAAQESEKSENSGAWRVVKKELGL